MTPPVVPDIGIGQPVAYPVEAAATVAKWAGRLHHDAARAALQLVRDMVGNPEDVKRAVGAWRGAATGMNNAWSEEGLAHQAIAGISAGEKGWEGPAYTAFNPYFTDLKTTTAGNQQVLINLGKETATFYNTVLDTYRECVNFIFDCAQAVTAFFKSLDWEEVLAVAAAGATFGASLLLILKPMLDALDAMTENIQQRVDGFIQISGKFNTTLLNLSSESAGLASPPSVAENVCGM